ncbi:MULTISPECIES: hypothetical protein [unclassified Granulicatella]|uniref:hypothetical protein n=1 Tax=unclassified Granulicatella TaxID=2630493 RepID=UPI0010749941|nr:MULTISPECIES: hypothetical protein [unclassified Granulicatella]MBF0779659.1 hypothetical protein [Granulicatella sp. 19428wC4_WM01]TFU96315.1 hypothetical protein E4T68_01000 [Granulicatella sp. WM01]
MPRTKLKVLERLKCYVYITHGILERTHLFQVSTFPNSTVTGCEMSCITSDEKIVPERSIFNVSHSDN